MRCFPSVAVDVPVVDRSMRLPVSISTDYRRIVILMTIKTAVPYRKELCTYSIFITGTCVCIAPVLLLFLTGVLLVRYA